jgi:hypothetical protein
MRTEAEPNSDYTRTWSPSGEIEYARLAGGMRLRHLAAGSGPTALILLHTVRTQLDQFQLVIPKVAHAFAVYAIDMLGMGWSDINPGASYTEPALRRAIVEFVKTLDVTGGHIGRRVDGCDGVADGLDRTGRPRATHPRVQHVRLLRRRQSSQSRRLDLRRRCTPPRNRLGGHTDGEQTGPRHRDEGRSVRREQAAKSASSHSVGFGFHPYRHEN